MSASSRTGGLAAWAIRHPIGVSMIALALVALGLVSLLKLGVDLLPELIYPEVRVRIIDPGVPATVMEDRVTRQLEEQLAITEGAISVQSRTSEGRSSVDLSFPYGTDIDIALRDASTRLDRAKRFLPDTIDPPVIFKRDPAQLPVMELAVSSNERDTLELRTWVDYQLRRWFINLPGVASAEVGGGLEREIQVLPDILKLQALGIGIDKLIEAIRSAHLDMPIGRLETPSQYTSVRLPARFENSAALARLPLGDNLLLADVADVHDFHANEKLRIRYNQQEGVKLTIQKQPQANTVEVADAVEERLQWLKSENIIPTDIQLNKVSDQSVYVRSALNNAVLAVLSGAALAMFVVFIFLGDWRRTLVIGSAIPIALMVTFIFMAWGGLTLNIMTLGGLAVGVGMLVDSAIVMLENIARHQHDSHDNAEKDELIAPAIDAAREINSAIVASTSTNLAAVLPFLFISGLVGLLFRELIFTIAAAMLAAMLIALTLVPALAARLRPENRRHSRVGAWFQRLYVGILSAFQRVPWLILLLFIGLIALSLQPLLNGKQIFLPDMDDGQVNLSITSDNGIALDRMDEIVAQVEDLLMEQSDVEGVFSQIGGRTFGRSTYEASHTSSLNIQLVPLTQRHLSTDDWIKQMNKKFTQLKLVGVQLRMRTAGIRGIRISSGDDDISIRVQGDDLETLAQIGDKLVEQLEKLPQLRNLTHSYEDVGQELAVEVDRDRAEQLGLNPERIGDTLAVLLDGRSVGDFIEGDRAFDIRVRLPGRVLNSPAALRNIILRNDAGRAISLAEVAELHWMTTPSEIVRDQQRRIVDVSASLAGEAALGDALQAIQQQLAGFELPDGYVLYDGGSGKALAEGRQLSAILLALAIFLVFVVMAVQYESLQDPLVILFSVPFAVCGLAGAIYFLQLPLSMPVWLGLIMLAGIVVNNSIILIETIELQRQNGLDKLAAIREAARLRLRPISMTTFSTVAGLSPLALGWGEGAEMLQPLAITIVFGLSFSLLVSLLLVPTVYQLFRR